MTDLLFKDEAMLQLMQRSRQFAQISVDSRKNNA